jgi:hypothetical protein
MTVEQQLNVLSEALKQKIISCTDSGMIAELVQHRNKVLQLEKKVTGANISRATAEYVAFTEALNEAAKTVKQEIDDLNTITKWIERSGRAIGKVCELAAKFI